MTKAKATKLRGEVEKAFPGCMVLILDRGFGIGFVVTVEVE